jgi:HlyD family secretion protein/macrolide-specific efflux system membrane fusion protein
MKKCKLIFVFLIIIFLFLSCNNSKESKKIEFEYYTVKKGSIENIIKLTGVIKPEIGAEIKVGSRISGKVEKLFVKVGDKVKKGDLIAIIEHNDLKLQIDKLQSEKSYYLVQLQNIKSEYPLKIKSKNLSIKSLKIKLKYLKKELNRNLSLFKENMVSEQSIDNLRKQVKSLEFNIQSELKILELTKKEFKDRVKEINTKIIQINHQIAIAQIDYNYAFIKAPISGTISTVSTQEGETVAASFNSPVFVNIIDLNRLEVVAYVDETDIGKVKLNQEVRFYVETYPNKIFTGKIKKIYPKAEVVNNVVTYKIEAAIDSDKSILKPEMTAYLDIILNKKNNVIVAPLKCIKLIGTENFAFIRNRDNFKKVRVKTGIVNNGIVEIVSGLKEGDKILLKGFKNVHSF